MHRPKGRYVWRPSPFGLSRGPTKTCRKPDPESWPDVLVAILRGCRWISFLGGISCAPSYLEPRPDPLHGSDATPPRGLPLGLARRDFRARVWRNNDWEDTSCLRRTSGETPHIMPIMYKAVPVRIEIDSLHHRCHSKLSTTVQVCRV